MQVRSGFISDLWWKNAVIYGVDVKCFQDSDDDGIGDFPGLTERLEYLASLGVTCLWLLPIMPSPWRDNGYDVTDYYNVHPHLGTLGDVVDCLRTARELGLRVITDLVVNHTSDQHPWFQQARSSRDNPFRDWYVWRDRPDKEPEGVSFPGEEDSNWCFDEGTGQWYLHRFYHFQPDLNIENPKVRREINKMMGFWLQLGFSGFRIDAAPFLIETAGIPGKTPDHDPQAPLRDMRGFLSRRRGDAILLGEANVAPDRLTDYFGERGDELHLLLNFVLNQGLYLSLAREDPGPLRDHLEELPKVPRIGQFVNFVRNADELTLDKLSKPEQEEVFRRFAPEASMRLYGHGIRRRLPPMVDGDRRRIELAYSLLFSLPDTPLLLYGEEIGLGDDLSTPGRGSVRVAMQWTDRPGGGFSDADPGEFLPPLVSEGPFGSRQVNVAAQRRDPRSLLNRVARMIHLRREAPEIGFGRWRLLDTDQPGVLAHRCDWEGGTFVALHNFTGNAVQVKLDLGDDDVEGVGAGRVEELFADQAEEHLETVPPEPPGARPPFALQPFGYQWLRLHRDDGSDGFRAGGPTASSG